MNEEYAELFFHHQISYYPFIYGGGVMLYSLEIDVVPLLVGVAPLRVGDGGCFVVVVMVAYWYMWWPHGRRCGLLLVVATSWQWLGGAGDGDLLVHVVS